MTALRAQRASKSADAVLALIRLPGSRKSFEFRDSPRKLGLLRDHAGHAWHGRLAGGSIVSLERKLGVATSSDSPDRVIFKSRTPRARFPKSRFATADGFVQRFSNRR
jgi:hypothetical protein